MGSSNRREADRGYDERMKVFSHSYETQRLNRRCDYVAMVLEILSLRRGKAPNQGWKRLRLSESRQYVKA